jgi:hypothetical protein
MSDDVVPVAKAIQEVEPAVQAFAEATGVLGPVQELAAWATDLIRYRRAPYQARLLMSAAEKIRESGLPPRAVEDKLLRAVLEDGPMEDDEDMQDRWANLLANAGTGLASVRVAFPKILSELEPVEASAVDMLVEETSFQTFRAERYSLHDLENTAIRIDGLDNLVRLGLLRYTRTMPTTTGEIDDRSATTTGAMLTDLGWEFVQACRAPRPRD